MKKAGISAMIAISFVGLSCGGGGLSEDERNAISMSAREACEAVGGDESAALAAAQNPVNGTEAVEYLELQIGVQCEGAQPGIEPGTAAIAGSEVSAECLSAMQLAASAPESQDTAEDLWPTFRSCATEAEWKAAAVETGEDRRIDIELWVMNQCQFEPAVQGSPVCVDAGH